jgi:hypothetical protein
MCSWRAPVAGWRRSSSSASTRRGRSPKGKASTHGVKIVFFGPGGAEQTLYYFETNLANEGIKANPGFLKFCDQLGTAHSLVKAASYLMHLEDFSSARNFLLEHSAAILEDDSGVPLKYFDSSKWLLRFFGSYPGPIALSLKSSINRIWRRAYTCQQRAPFAVQLRVPLASDANVLSFWRRLNEAAREISATIRSQDVP